MKSDARISKCGKYRYWLSREWGMGKPCLFIMLNPSTADAAKDDPTIRRCVGFAKSWGYEKIYVGNLFAIRSTNPRGIFAAPIPNPPDAKEYLRSMVDCVREAGGICIAAWGNHGAYDGQDNVMVEWFREFQMPLYVLGLTKRGQPLHPLYVKANVELQRWIRK